MARFRLEPTVADSYNDGEHFLDACSGFLVVLENVPLPQVRGLGCCNGGFNMQII